MTIHVMVGLPGAGKTTLAKKLRGDLGGIIISKDIVRYQMLGVEFDPDLENEVERMFSAMLSSGLWGYIDDVIIDNTNLTKSIRKTLIDKAHVVGRDIVAHVFSIDKYAAWDRKQRMGSDMTIGDFERLAGIYEPVSKNEGFSDIIVHG